MSSRRRREHESSSRREAYKIWVPPESDSDHPPRQTMTTSQRPNVEQAVPPGHEKHHRSRRAEAPVDVHTSSYTHLRVASKEQANPAAQSSFYTVAQAQAQLLQNTVAVPLAETTQPVSGSSRSRTKEPSSSKESHGLRTYLRRKTEKRSSPSSDEKILVDHARSTYTTKQPRDPYQTGDSAPLAPASTQTYWIPEQSAKDVSSSRQRDREKEKERERRHAEKARLKEEERARRKEEERIRLREEERARDRAAEAERERRREKEAERERRRLEKEKDRERSSKHRDREKRDYERRRRDDSRYPDYANGQPQIQSASNQLKLASADDMTSVSTQYVVTYGRC